MRKFKADQLPPSRHEVNFGLISRGYKAVDLELGCGDGEFAAGYASRNPDRLVIAIERTALKSKRFFSRRESQKLSNLRFYRDNAVHWIAQHVPESSISHIFLWYPNPYPKPRQKNKRWHHMPFFGVLLARLKSHGFLHFATNLKWHAQDWETALLQYPAMSLQKAEEITELSKARTAFERKYLARGEASYRFIYEKVDDPLDRIR